MKQTEDHMYPGCEYWPVIWPLLWIFKKSYFLIVHVIHIYIPSWKTSAISFSLLNSLVFQNNAKLSFATERAEGGQGEQQSLSGSWTSPQLPSRAQSVRSPAPHKKQLHEQLQRRSSTVLGQTVLLLRSSLCFRLFHSHCFPGCFWLNFSAVGNSQVRFRINETIA